MKIRNMMSIGLRGAEAVITMLIVLGFFSLFAMFLMKIFIPGTSLGDLLSKGEPTGSSIEADPGRDAMLDAGGREGLLGDAFRSAARLEKARNEVKSKRSDSIAWGPAIPGMPLYNRDAVQTFKGSSAQISLDRKSSFTVDSNSLVIIRRVEKDLFSSQRHSAMVVLEGEMKGKLSGTGKDQLNLEVTTPGAVAKLNGRSVKGADFSIAANPDQSSSIVVYKGSAEVKAGGRIVKVPENTGLMVRPGEAPGGLVPLPPPPELHTPADGSIYTFRKLPPKVRFSWVPAQGAEMTHFQLARDPNFKDIVLDRKSDQREIIHGNLNPGKYFWRLSAIRSGCEGKFSSTRVIHLNQDLTPPALDVKFPAGPVAGSRFLLAGFTEPGAHLFLSGKEIAVAGNGSFEHEVVLAGGVTLITVEAVDAAGNVAYRSHSIQGRSSQ